MISSVTVCLYSVCMEKKRCNGSITIRWKKDLKKEYTRLGVRSLVEDSHLMKLLRELDKDGFNVDGPLAELVALVNYVTSSQMTMQDLQTHLDYCAEQLRKQTT